MLVSVTFFPSINDSKEFLTLAAKNSCICCVIFICFSLSILVIVDESLQDTFGIIGVPKYSPTSASICFLINGINSTAVGFPIPKLSCKYLNYSGSRLPV
jgi:hypothetical protein